MKNAKKDCGVDVHDVLLKHGLTEEEWKACGVNLEPKPYPGTIKIINGVGYIYGPPKTLKKSASKPVKQSDSGDEGKSK